MKKMKRVFVAGGLLLIILAAFFTTKTIQEQDMNGNIAYARKTFAIPELAVVVVSSERILFENASGYHRNDTLEPAKPEDRFHLGSCTKAITSLIAGKLVDEGKIRWNQKLLEIYPEFGNVCTDEYQAVTLADLLSNRAGIQPFTNELPPEFPGTLIQQRREFTRWLVQRPKDSQWIENSRKLGFNIESKDKPFVYSNAGYTAAASMMEKVTGQPWENLIIDYLQDELDIRPAFGWPNRINPKQPWGHALIENKMTPIPPENKYEVSALIAPAGDLNLSGHDFAKLLQMQLQGLRGADNFLTAETYAYIHKSLPGYALGWENINLFGHRVSLHDGSAGTFYCIAAIDDAHDLAFLVMANAGGTKAQQGVYWLAYKIFKNYNKLYGLFFL